jgi:hypothetical protein
MTAENSFDSEKPAVTPEEKPPSPVIPMVPSVPEKLGGVVWDKIGTFTIKTIIPTDDP